VYACVCVSVCVCVYQFHSWQIAQLCNVEHCLAHFGDVQLKEAFGFCESVLANCIQEGQRTRYVVLGTSHGWQRGVACDEVLVQGRSDSFGSRLLPEVCMYVYAEKDTTRCTIE
jgi:hypothetical protein